MTARFPALTSPQPLAASHDIDDFTSGVASLDDWLKGHARHNETEGGSRTFVLCSAHRVIGYFSLAAGSLLPASATGRIRRNMPNPIPVIVLGHLAIDRSWQGKGLGSDLLRDAVLRAMTAGSMIGVRAVLVHALSPQAKAFYERHGFRTSPIDPMMLMISLAEVERLLA